MSARILIVEDEMLVALELKSILQELGYGILGIAPDLPTARDVGEALAWLERQALG